MPDAPDQPRGPHHPDVQAAPYARDLPHQSTPKTHRTPPDIAGMVAVVEDDGALVIWDELEGAGWAYQGGAALPALVAALAAHLPEDARRALTRDLAAQDRDTVVMTAVALHVAEIAESTGERNTSIWSLRGAAQDSIARRRAADGDAATTPPPGEEGQ